MDHGNYRESYNLFACSGILFNHESPRRGLEFVTLKVSHMVPKIKLGLVQELCMGNLDSKRDWGFEGDCVEALWRMFQHSKSEDLVVATGVTHSVRQLMEMSFSVAGMTLGWEGHGVEEKGIDVRPRKVVVSIAPGLFRPAEVDLLIGDPAKAKTCLGWSPRILFEKLIDVMVWEDMVRLTGR